MGHGLVLELLPIVERWRSEVNKIKYSVFPDCIDMVESRMYFERVILEVSTTKYNWSNLLTKHLFEEKWYLSKFTFTHFL